MITVILGAGFSYIGGFPLASELFNESPEVDRIVRQRLVGRVIRQWRLWQESTGGTPEQYLAFLHQKNDRNWLDALWFVGLVIALKVGRVEFVGMKPTITRHNLDRTTQIPSIEDFWSIIFRRTFDVSVITTNYDILPERGLRMMPRPRVHRPGFHYGNGVEELAGGGYPSYSHIQKSKISGSVPLYKLHGSISWSFRSGCLIRYHDCRSAIRGDAAIVAPMTSKVIPHYLKVTWHQAANALASSNIWIVVGYSLPDYDKAVRDLLSENGKHKPQIHIFDPNPIVAKKFSQLLPHSIISTNPGLPDGLPNIDMVMKAVYGY